MIKIGMIIGGRYEILEKIGTGGMSDVYKAKDHKLNRFVAIKVLKQEFSENANFVSKFRVEAQAAAGLTHPNIVNVYDVGEENGIYYIVMELVEGITLKKYIEKKSRLSYKEAVSVAIQVSMGIEAAHNNHIIHRDIKPQNIIISKDGKVKVTDFGIAKAATSNTITSNVMGSVHYTSPEQARGGYSDEKSDIYSLGITMFEMLTGRVPFNGETTVAIAIKHIQEELPYPSDFVPEIPASVENIVLKCCQKSPDRRYQTVQELIADLKQSLINPDEDFVVQYDPDLDGGTRMITDDDMMQIKRQTVYPEYEEQDGMDMAQEPGDYYEEPEPDYMMDEDMEDAEEDDEDGDEYDYNPSMEKATTIIAVLGGIVICIIVVLLALRMTKAWGDGGRGPGSGSSHVDTGEDESPSPGASLGQGSSGAENPDGSDLPEDEEPTVKMPYLVGMELDDGVSALRNLGLEAGEINHEYNDRSAGEIFAQSYSVNEELKKGTVVLLWVSDGPEPTQEPATYSCRVNIVAPTPEEAPDYIQGSGVHIRIETDPDADGNVKILEETDVSSFPYEPGLITNLTVPGGKITFTYTVEVPGQPIVDPDTGEQIIPAPTVETRSFTRKIEFIKE